MRRLLGRLRKRVRAILRPEPYRIRTGAHVTPTDVSPLTADEQAIVDAFHKLYYEQRVDGRQTVLLSWFGHRILKCPFDIWTYQEIIHETRPELIVECGTRYGGGALYLAMELVDGADLRRILEASRKKKIPLLVGEAVQIGIDMCRGLHHAHTLRDVDGRPSRRRCGVAACRHGTVVVAGAPLSARRHRAADHDRGAADCRPPQHVDHAGRCGTRSGRRRR